MKKLRQLSGILALAGLLSVQSGCCTLEHLMDPEQKLSMYGGTADCVRDMEDPRATFWEVAFRLIDIFPTIAADTLILPVTAPWELTH
ncbi:MAG: hypothetical protein VX387_10405 [Planctomycetota bacterium]|nr:hypothetical protein [Planctomycetota bacterium]MEC8934136.1 hypothetical protein [Planctomycetota bacterium]MEC9350126.1 hypothetical protein [Planctomycetota bacterium]